MSPARSISNARSSTTGRTSSDSFGFAALREYFFGIPSTYRILTGLVKQSGIAGGSRLGSRSEVESFRA